MASSATPGRDGRDQRLAVLALLPYALDCAPSQRYRIEQWRPLLEREGVTVRLSPFITPRTMAALHTPGRLLAKVTGTLNAYQRRLRQLLRPPACDAVFLHREAFLLGPTRLERLLLQRLSLVYDFDDAIYLPAPSKGNPWTVAAKSTAKAAALCRIARHITAGNETLADFAKPHGRAVSVVPSTIDTDQYRLRERPPNDRLVVGWTGSPSTAPYLQRLRGPLLTLKGIADFELRVIGAEIALPGLDVRCVPWRMESEVDDLRFLDVGLMPLPDDPWTRGKCGMKALQYMGLEIPPVVSPVGVNGTIVKDGVNGLHARTDAEWVEKVAVLLRSSDLRARLGAAARRTVEQEYSARVHAPRLARILEATAAPGLLRTRGSTRRHPLA